MAARTVPESNPGRLLMLHCVRALAGTEPLPKHWNVALESGRVIVRTYGGRMFEVTARELTEMEVTASPIE
jgi:hypothetical protein